MEADITGYIVLGGELIVGIILTIIVILAIMYIFTKVRMKLKSFRI